jgi:hypothetical protein
MAKCGIEKYDNLPARVGWIDVDYNRWILRCIDKPSWLYKFKLLSWFFYPQYPRHIIIEYLEEAYILVNKNAK